MGRHSLSSPLPVVVLGAGAAGLATAATLSLAGVPVTLLAPPRPASMRDRRTSALMVASVRLLTNIGVWNECAESAAPLKRLRIVDDTRRLIHAPTVTFDAAEIGEEAFGWNVPNEVLTAALGHQLQAAGRVNRIEAIAREITACDTAARIVADDGRCIDAAVVLAADGRDSVARAGAGIDVDRWDYDQSAIVANLRHDVPHENVSTEFHRPVGPFTLVPLPGGRSSLVWVDGRRAADAVALFDERSLAREIERLSHRLLGRVELDGPIQSFPLGGLVARRLAHRRVILIGEAGHLLPPIGAQGLNLGLRDAAVAAELVSAAVAGGSDPGGPAVLAEYDRRRRVDVSTRTRAVDLMNRALLSGLLPVQAVRALGLAALAMPGPLRWLAMREGVAPGHRLPRLMQSSR